MRIEIFMSDDPEELKEVVNEFLEDKEAVSISHDMAVSSSGKRYVSVIVLIKD